MNGIQEYGIYYAPDKDIYDILISAKKQLSVSHLLELARERGIFLSEDNSREEIIDYLSSLPFDHYELTLLLEHVQTGKRKEKSTNYSIPSVITADQLRLATNALKSERQVHRDAISATSFGENNFLINIDYTAMDYTKTRLKQRDQLEAKIEIEIHPEGLKLRHPSNEYVNTIVKTLLNKLDEITGVQLERKKIDISGLATPQQKTLFFTNLIGSSDNYTLNDVSIVKVERDFSPAENDSDEEEQEDNEELEGSVKKALLSGSGLLYSDEYRRLNESGFFISKTRWVGSSHLVANGRIEFEASFDEDEKTFKYSILGKYNLKPDSSFTKSRRPITEEERKGLLVFLEEKAWQSQQIVESMSEPSGDINDPLSVV